MDLARAGRGHHRRRVGRTGGGRGRGRRQADAILGAWPVPGRIEWHAEEGTGIRVRRERAWQLVQLRIGLGAGLDPLPTLIGLRNHGATWDEIARAAGITRQAAHERWASRVRALLEPGS